MVVDKGYRPIRYAFIIDTRTYNTIQGAMQATELTESQILYRCKSTSIKWIHWKISKSSD